MAALVALALLLGSCGPDLSAGAAHARRSRGPVAAMDKAAVPATATPRPAGDVLVSRWLADRDSAALVVGPTDASEASEASGASDASGASGASGEPARGPSLVNPFMVTSWAPPPAPPEPIAPQPKIKPPPQVAVAPVAPPLPFQYLGSYVDGSQHTVVLVKGDQVYTVAEGDTVENLYQVVHITADVVELLYLPLKVVQSIRTGQSS